jgi:hypothetical protein
MLVGHVLHPVNILAADRAGDSYVADADRRGRAVPVLDARWTPHDVARRRLDRSDPSLLLSRIDTARFATCDDASCLGAAPWLSTSKSLIVEWASRRTLGGLRPRSVVDDKSVEAASSHGPSGAFRRREGRRASARNLRHLLIVAALSTPEKEVDRPSLLAS